MKNYNLFLLLLLFVGLVNAGTVSIAIDINRENIGATSLKSRGLVFFAGGLARFAGGNDVNVRSVDIYNINTNQWTTSQLSLGRYEISATSLDSKGLAFFSGGAYVPNGDMTKNSLLTNIIDIFNATSNTWTTAVLSVNRSGVASTALDKQNLVFFAGGYISINNGYPEFTTNVIDIWNITSNTWSTSTLHIKNMFVFATALSNYGLAFMGGAFQKKLSIYNANTNSWSEADLSLETNYGAACVLESYGLAFFAGGATQNNIISNTIDIYDAKTNSWTKQFLSSVRAGLACASLDKYGLVFFAGGGDTQNQLNTVDIYDVKTNTWTVSYINSRRAIIGAASLEDFAFFGGGYSSSDFVTGIDVFGSCQGGIAQINQNSCLECPAGSFCNYQISPINCPTGTYCGVNVSKPTLCPSGTYNELTGSSAIGDCLKCPLGTYNGNLGVGTIANCLSCQLGTYCPEGSIVSQACPENNYCPDPRTKVNCPAGTYLDETFATNAARCKKCFRGHYCNGKGGSPIPCSPGTYADKEGSNECRTCPGGFSCAFGATDPLICEMNYIAKKGASACTACPSGTYTDGSGTTDCIPCSGGQFDVSGWWCMSTFERVLFVGVWAGTFLSIYASIKKIYEFVKNRLKKIREADLSFTWKRFIFIDRIVANRKSGVIIDKLDTKHMQPEVADVDYSIPSHVIIPIHKQQLQQQQQPLDSEFEIELEQQQQQPQQQKQQQQPQQQQQQQQKPIKFWQQSYPQLQRPRRIPTRPVNVEPDQVPNTYYRSRSNITLNRPRNIQRKF